MIFRILIVDDEPLVRKSIRKLLEKDKYEVEEAEDGHTAQKMILETEFDLAIVDLILGDMDGIELIKLVKKKYPDLLVIMITGHGNIESAVQAMKIGAYDYIEKPFKTEAFRKTIANALQNVRLQKEVEELRARYSIGNKMKQFIGESKEIQAVLNMVDRYAPTDITVLIEGESGTGKELIAQYIHYKSPRFAEPYVPLNCGAIAPTLIESELFGYVSGAFTGASKEGKIGYIEKANNGTLFLDEIGEMPLEAQVKLLRVLETGEFYRVGGSKNIKIDVRIIAASNRSLRDLIDKGKFRKDLYFRLDIAKIELPPLRERRDDIVPMAKHFLQTYSSRFGKKINGFSPAVEEILLRLSWPGNARELRNFIERITLLTNNETIKSQDLQTAGFTFEQDEHDMAIQFKTNTGNNVLNEVNMMIIKKALTLTKQNKTKAAKLLGIPRTTLRYYLERSE